MSETPEWDDYCASQHQSAQRDIRGIVLAVVLGLILWAGVIGLIWMEIK